LGEERGRGKEALGQKARESSDRGKATWDCYRKARGKIHRKEERTADHQNALTMKKNLFGKRPEEPEDRAVRGGKT